MGGLRWLLQKSRGAFANSKEESECVFGPQQVLPSVRGDWAAAGALRPDGYSSGRLRAALVPAPAALQPRGSSQNPPGAACRMKCAVLYRIATVVHEEHQARAPSLLRSLQ